MPALRAMSDNEFDLAIVDPPYGIGIGKGGKIGGSKPFGSDQFRHGIGLGIVEAKKYKPFDDSSIPDEEYFIEVKRVSKNQIIWGANYFINYLMPSPSIIVWDKQKSGGFFADGELALDLVYYIKWKWNGMLQQNMKEKEIRIHHTQKPVALYRWLLQNYAEQGDRILDTHLGSGSIALACWDLGFDLVGYEIDEDYFSAATERLERHKAQLQLF